MAASQCGRDKVEKLRRALFDRNWDEAESVIGQIPEGKLLPIIHVDKERWSVLHVAALVHAPAHVVQRILDVVDVEFCMQRDANGNNPLHRLCKLLSKMPCDIEHVRLLALVRPQAFYEMNREEGTIPFRIMLGIADLWFSSEQIAQLLVDVATAWPDGVYSVNEHGQNLLHQSIHYRCSYTGNNFAVVGAILELAPELMERTDENGQTPVHFAAQQQMGTFTPALMEILVNRDGCCALDLRGPSGRMPLHVVCANSNTTGNSTEVRRAVIQILVKKYPDALYVEDDAGMTPLTHFRRRYKSRRSHPPREESIVEAAMTLMTGVPLRCSDSPSLHSLLRHELCTLDIARFFVTALPDQASVQDENGNLPLHVVSTMPDANDRYFVDVVERLLEVYPFACKIPNRSGLLPLELMALSGKTWKNGMRLVFLEHPAAVAEFGSNSDAICRLLAVLGREQSPDAIFRLLQDAPDLLFTS